MDKTRIYIYIYNGDGVSVECLLALINSNGGELLVCMFCKCVNGFLIYRSRAMSFCYMVIRIELNYLLTLNHTESNID